MTYANPALDSLTASGTPFEIAREGDARFFRNAPTSLNDLMESARRHGAATAIVEGDVRYSFADVFARRDALAATLDVAAGQRVAIAMRNTASWMIGFLAIIRVGAVAVLANSRAAGGEMRAAIEECDVAVVLADDARAAALRAAGYVGRIIEAKDFPTSADLTRPMPAPASDDPAAILFTSGTTGRVKGAVLSHKNLVTGLMCVQLAGMVVLKSIAEKYDVPVETIMARAPQAASILVFPLFHISGLGSGFLSQLLAGGKIVIMRRWDPEEALHLIQSEKVTMLTAVPTMLWDMLHRANIGTADLSSLTAVSSGGQGLPLNLLDAVRKAIPGAFLGSGFGLTETAGAVAMSTGPDFLRKPASSGRVLALTDIRILGAADEILAPGMPGEIVVRGPMVMKEYWNRPEETAQVLDKDGWFRTGDIGYVDDEGYIFIVDRKKDMVISGGENIYCAEVERAITQLPDVSEVAAFGVPDERLGERLVVVLTSGSLTESGVQDHVATSLAPYKSPTQVVFSRDPLPRNSAGKIDKNKLRAAWPAISGES